MKEMQHRFHSCVSVTPTPRVVPLNGAGISGERIGRTRARSALGRGWVLLGVLLLSILAWHPPVQNAVIRGSVRREHRLQKVGPAWATLGSHPA